MRLSAHWPRRDSVRMHNGTKTLFVPEMQFETVPSARLRSRPSSWPLWKRARQLQQGLVSEKNPRKVSAPIVLKGRSAQVM